MRKIVFSTILMVMICSLCYAGSKEVNKAKDFIKARMFRQAAAILEKEINDSPTNAEAHFQLGIVYMSQGNYVSADERFSSAISINPDKYGFLVGEQYKKAGFSYLRNGQREKAEGLFSKAIEYQPVLRQEICDTNYRLGNEADDFSCVNYYLIVGRYCGQYSQPIGKRLLKIANIQSTADAREKYITYAKKFIPLEDILEMPKPSLGWRVQGTDLVADLQPGGEAKRIFTLKEGETTPQLVLPPEYYRIRVDHQQPIIVEVNGIKTLVRPDDLFKPGDYSGEKRYKFTALKDGTEVIVILRRLNR